MTEDSSAYVGTVIVEDEELVSIVLTIRSVPDDKAHMLCESAELDVTGRVTGDGRIAGSLFCANKFAFRLRNAHGMRLAVGCRSPTRSR